MFTSEMFRGPRRLAVLALTAVLAVLAVLAYPDVPRLILVVIAIQLSAGAFVWTLLHKTRTDLDHIDKTVHTSRKEILRQTQALIAIHSTVQFRYPLPEMGGWAISPDLAEFLITQVRATKPRVVVETGSGVSTILIGYLLQQLGGGRLISLDHDERFAAESRANVHLHGLGDMVEVIYAPLKPVEIKGETWQWYDLERVPELTGPIDLLLVDGPPQMIRSQARYPAVPLLAERLAADARILMDDAARPDERRIAERWVAELPGCSYRLLGHEKGTAILQRGVR